MLLADVVEAAVDATLQQREVALGGIAVGIAAAVLATRMTHGLVPAGPAFILTREGELHTLSADGGRGITIEMTATTPETRDADTRTDRPMIVVESGKSYELFVWDDDWVSLGKQVAGDEPVPFDSVPTGGLLWLVEEDSRRLERIFTIEDGKQVWW